MRILLFCRMLSTRTFTDRTIEMPPTEGWSLLHYLSNVQPMAGTDGERTVFRRRLGRNLAAFRRAAGYAKQEDVGALLGVVGETVGRWERGLKEPKAYELHRLAELYRARPDWLLSPTDSTTEMDVRAAILRQAASEAAQAAVADEIARRAAADKSPRRGRARG